MYNYVKVMPEEDFFVWYADTTAAPEIPVDSPIAAGKRIMTNLGCFACHSLDGSRLVGPTFKNLYGSPRTVVTAGKKREVIADDEYILKSIYDPNADLVDGFGRGLMISYESQLSREDIAQIIEYLKTLN